MSAAGGLATTGVYDEYIEENRSHAGQTILDTSNV